MLSVGGFVLSKKAVAVVKKRWLKKTQARVGGHKTNPDAAKTTGTWVEDAVKKTTQCLCLQRTGRKR